MTLGITKKGKAKEWPGTYHSPRPLDYLDFAGATIEDHQGHDRDKPRVIVSSGSSDLMNIDIIATIKKYPTSIEHPAIKIAICHWSAVIRFYYHLMLRREAVESYKLARKHLKHAGNSLFEEARDCALSKGEALHRQRRAVDYFHLRLAWEFLHKHNIKGESKILNNDLRFKKLEEEVCKDEFWSWYAHRVLNFLKSDEGSFFVKQPKQWAAIRNAFDGWRFGMDSQIARSFQAQLSRASVGQDYVDFDVDQWVWKKDFLLSDVEGDFSLPIVLSKNM